MFGFGVYRCRWWPTIANVIDVSWPAVMNPQIGIVSAKIDRQSTLVRGSMPSSADLHNYTLPDNLLCVAAIAPLIILSRRAVDCRCLHCLPVQPSVRQG